MSRPPGKIPGQDLGSFPSDSPPRPPGKLPTERLRQGAASFDWDDVLLGLQLPADREELVEQARAHGMGDEIIEALAHLPAERFRTRDEVINRLQGPMPRPPG